MSSSLLFLNPGWLDSFCSGKEDICSTESSSQNGNCPYLILFCDLQNFCQNLYASIPLIQFHFVSSLPSLIHPTSISQLLTPWNTRIKHTQYHYGPVCLTYDFAMSVPLFALCLFLYSFILCMYIYCYISHFLCVVFLLFCFSLLCGPTRWAF